MRLKKIIFTFSILLLLLIIFQKYYCEKTVIFNCKIINQNEKIKIINEKALMQDTISLTYNGYNIPKMADNTFLLPQGDLDSYKGILSSEGYQIAIIKPKYNKESIMLNNIGLSMIVYDDKQYKEIELYLTSLPVVNLEPISYEYDYYRDNSEYEIVTGMLQIINPKGNHSQNTYEVYEGKAKYRIRGAGTRAFPKHSYKLNLIDDDGSSKNDDLLEMRKDNDWILNAMYLDESKVREKISYDLSNYTDNSVEYSSEYVELIIEGKYKGLYLLQEPIDYKTFGSKKRNSIIYSIKKQETKHNELFSDEITNSNKDIVDEFEIELNEYTNYNEALDILKNIVCDLHNDKIDSINYNLNTFINYKLITDMVLATDNSYKNQVFIVNKKNNEYYMEKTIWDMDVSILENEYNEHNVNEIIDDFFVPKEIKNSQEYLEGLSAKYARYRVKFYNMSTINNLLAKYYKEIEQSGAILRDSNCWGNDEYIETKELIYDFFKDRINVLDKYYGYGG